MNGKQHNHVFQALILGIFLLSVPGMVGQAKSEESIHTGEAGEQMLPATLQISISLTASRPSGIVQVTAFGLGTLVSLDGGTAIVTHNHWGDLLQDGSQVEIRDAGGALLASLPGARIIKLVRYQDPGTLLLRAPREVLARLAQEGKTPPAALPFGEAGDPPALKKGDVVQVAYRPAGQFEQVKLLDAEIESLGKVEGAPVFNLRSLNGEAVAPGDSGGGVWFHGRLVGNMWARVLLEKTVTTKGSASTVIVETPRCYSALLPALH